MRFLFYALFILGVINVYFWFIPTPTLGAVGTGKGIYLFFIFYYYCYYFKSLLDFITSSLEILLFLSEDFFSKVCVEGLELKKLPKMLEIKLFFFFS